MSATDGDIRLLTDCAFGHVEMYELLGMDDWEEFERAAVKVIVAEKGRDDEM